MDEQDEKHSLQEEEPEPPYFSESDVEAGPQVSEVESDEPSEAEEADPQPLPAAAGEVDPQTQRILETHSKDLQLTHELVSALYHRPDPNPWKEAMDDADFTLYSILPALLEAKRIQSLEENAEAPGYSPEELAWIRTTPFEEIQKFLAEEFKEIPDLEPSPEITSILQKLKSRGVQDRTATDTLISFALQKMEDFKNLKDSEGQIHLMTQEALSGHLASAMVCEDASTIFAILDERLQDLGEEEIKGLVKWLAARGCTEQLSQVLPLMNSFQSIFDALLSTEFPAARELLNHHLQIKLTALQDGELNDLFEHLVQDKRWRSFEYFLEASIAARLSNDHFKAAFHLLCKEKRFSTVLKFDRADLIEKLGPNAAFRLAKALIFSTRPWENVEPFYKAFADSSFFQKLNSNQYFELLKLATLEEKLELFEDLLDIASSPGFHLPPLSQEKYEELLLFCLSEKTWQFLEYLVTLESFETISTNTLTLLLIRIVKSDLDDKLKRDFADVLKAKQKSGEPIPPNAWRSCFYECLNSHSADLAMSFLPEIEFTLGELQDSIEFLISNGLAQHLPKLLTQKQAPKIDPDTLFKVIVSAIWKNLDEIYQIPFENRLSPEKYFSLLFGALESGYPPSIVYVLNHLQVSAIRINRLKSWAIAQLDQGNELPVERLFNALPVVTADLQEEFEELARNKGYPRLSASLWSRIWRKKAGADVDEPPAQNANKRRKIEQS